MTVLRKEEVMLNTQSHELKWRILALIFFAVFLGAEQPRAAEKLNTAFFSPAQELDDSGVIEALYKK
jgi:hypothetical protein